MGKVKSGGQKQPSNPVPENQPVTDAVVMFMGVKAESLAKLTDDEVVALDGISGEENDIAISRVHPDTPTEKVSAAIRFNVAALRRERALNVIARTSQAVVMFMGAKAADVATMTDEEVTLLAPFTPDEVAEAFGATTEQDREAIKDFSDEQILMGVVSHRRKQAAIALVGEAQPSTASDVDAEKVNGQNQPVDRVADEAARLEVAKRSHFERLREEILTVWTEADGVLPSVDELMAFAPASEGRALDTLSDVVAFVKEQRGGTKVAPAVAIGDYSNQKARTTPPAEPPAPSEGAGYSFHKK